MKGKPVAGRAPGMRAKGVLVTGIGRSRVKGVNWKGLGSSAKGCVTALGPTAAERPLEARNENAPMPKRV